MPIAWSLECGQQTTTLLKQCRLSPLPLVPLPLLGDIPQDNLHVVQTIPDLTNGKNRCKQPADLAVAMGHMKGDVLLSLSTEGTAHGPTTGTVKASSAMAKPMCKLPS